MDELAPLVAAAQAGDPEAFGRIARRFWDWAYLLACSTLQDDYLAEDAVQEALAEAYQSLSKLNNPRAFPGWLRLLVAKHCDRLRRGKKVEIVPYEEGPGSWENLPGLSLDVMRNRGFVKTQVDRLPRKQQMVTALYMAGYTPGEIADLLAVPLTTVRKRLHDARRQLRRRLGTRVLGFLQEVGDIQYPPPSFCAEGLAIDPSSTSREIALSSALPVGKHPAGVAMNSLTRRLYVVNEAVGESAGSLSVFDSDTNAAVTTLSLGRRPQAIAANPEIDRLYITHYFRRDIWVLHGTTHDVLATVALPGNPNRVDVDVRNNRIYVTTIADSTQGGTLAGLSVIDGSSHSLVATIPIGPQTPTQVGPICVRVSPANQGIYVAATDSLYVLNDTHRIVSRLSGLGTVTDVEINPITNRFYLSLHPRNSVMVGDGATHAIVADIAVDDEPNGLGVDQSADRVYVTHNNKGTISILSGATNSVTSVFPFSRTVPFTVGCHGGAAVDPLTSRIYVSGQDAGILFVLDCLSGHPMSPECPLRGM